eukprot:CAMPEP_0184865396 /NCGR_PEP_ID=MMETSP0580-20130426/17946_1 /TAXON_ID=1118495 /ORGANISM="Dactyliosolen fragilissimus" /LENGTH=341 /DNA_ID=CAMNT_0027364581 /DNA_START=16 /DNA_END=1041 /DNA_ORIENTATION=+
MPFTILSKVMCCTGGGDISTADVSNKGVSPGTDLKNSAVVFVKPHANTPSVQSLVLEKLREAAPSINILSTKSVGGKEIDDKKLIDEHYYAIASKATILKAEVTGRLVNKETFKDFFGEEWDDVTTEGRVGNAIEACSYLGCSEMELNDAWREAEGVEKVVKLGGGFYCGLVTYGDKNIYVFNAFFMSMRSKFVQPESSIQCYEIEWDASELSWEDFRNRILGPTDPSTAPEGSIRRTIYESYKELGLKDAPNRGDNGVHASASPFEGLAERCNWMGRNVSEDSFGMALLEAGIPKETIQHWCKDPAIKLPEGKVGSIFDELEDMDTSACFDTLLKLNALQ